MTNKAMKYGLMTIAAVLLVVMAFAGAASAESIYEIDSAEDFYQFVADVNASTVADTTFSAQLTDDITLDNKTVFNPTVKTNVILDLNGHVITSTHWRGSSFLLKENTVLDVYDNASSSVEHGYDAVTVYDGDCSKGISTQGGHIIGGGILWKPANINVDYTSAGNPKTTDGDLSGYNNCAPCGKCFQVGSGCVLVIHGGTFANFVGDCGGCIAIIAGGECFFDGGLITDCRCTCQGGGVNIWGNLTMSGGTITDCSASNYGGGVHIGNSGTFTITGGSITDCSASYGGGVCSFGMFSMTGGSITDCSGSNYGGGVIISDSGTFTITGGSITDCSASYGGGVFSVGMFSMTGGSITDCSASDGGGVYVSSGMFTMSGGTITGCSASDGGGVLNFGTFEMSGGMISGCSASSHGGGVFNKGTFTMSPGVISNCISKMSGAIHNEGTAYIRGTALIENCTAWDPSVNEGGGAIEIASSGKLYVEGGTFRNNTAVSKGGAILVWNGMVWISGGVFENNKAAYGGAITIGGHSGGYDSALTGGIFRGNTDDDGPNAIVTDCISYGKSAQLIVGGDIVLEDDQSFKVNALESGYPIRIGTPEDLPASPVEYTTEKFTGSIKNFIIDNENFDGCTLFEIKVKNDGQTATDVLRRIGLKDTTKWTLVANDSLKTISIELNKPVVSSASVLFNSSDNNATAYVNITLTDDNNAASAVVEFWNGGTKFKSSNLVTENLTKGSTVGGFVVEGLTDNTEYTVKAKLNMTDCTKYFDYDLGIFSCSDPKITEHPQSAVYMIGETATELTVATDAVDPKYQWENSTDGVIYNPISGANSSAYTPSNATVGIVYYRVNVTDNASGQSVNSTAAAVEVYDMYTITYDPALKQGSNPSTYSSNQTITLADPEKTHYVGSWVNSDTSCPVSIIYKGSTGNLNLTARYVPKEYIIDYYYNGGIHTNPLSYNIESGTIFLTDATKSGYEFIGWYSNSAFLGEKVTTISSADPADIKLYAQWYPLTITKEVTTEGNVQFSGYESVALARIEGTQTVLSEIAGLTPTKNITFVRAIPELSASDLPAKSGYYTNLYSAFEINYDGTLSGGGEAQITLKVTLANGDSADNLRVLQQSSSGWEALTDVSKTQSGNVVTIVGNVSSFSPFAVVSYSAQPQQYTPSSSSKQTGSTIILQEGQTAPTAYATATPTVAPTVKPTEQPATPTVIATEKPTTQATQQSPAPFLGILAGLGAAGLIYRLRK